MKARPPRCDKKRYEDKIDALLALAKVQHRDNPARPRMERRAYYHPACHHWHLTSMQRQS